MKTMKSKINQKLYLSLDLITKIMRKRKVIKNAKYVLKKKIQKIFQIQKTAHIYFVMIVGIIIYHLK